MEIYKWMKDIGTGDTDKVLIVREQSKPLVNGCR